MKKGSDGTNTHICMKWTNSGADRRQGFCYTFVNTDDLSEQALAGIKEYLATLPPDELAAFESMCRYILAHPGRSELLKPACRAGSTLPSEALRYLLEQGTAS